MKYNKILFLDVDGVINIPPYKEFNQVCLDNLRTTITKTNCKVVISSSWRTGDLELTKKYFPEWLQNEIVGETVRGYHFLKDGSSLPLVRGIEIKHWIDRNMVYPWHGNPEMKEQYSTYKEDGSFFMMRHNELNKDFTYVIIDDDQDMLYDQADNFILTDSKTGITQWALLTAIDILNKLDK